MAASSSSVAFFPSYSPLPRFAPPDRRCLLAAVVASHRRRPLLALASPTPISADLDSGRKGVADGDDNGEGKPSPSFHSAFLLRIRLLAARLSRLSAGGLPDALRRAAKRVSPSVLAPAVLALLLLFVQCSTRDPAREVAYSDLVADLRRGTVASAAFEEGSRRIYFNRKPELNAEAPPQQNANQRGSQNWRYYTRRIERDEEFLLRLMRKARVSYWSTPQPRTNSLVSMLTTLLTLWLSLAPMAWFLQRQLNAGGNARRKRRRGNQVIGFGDVEGVDAAKGELIEIVNCLQGSLNYEKLRVRLPRGVLLVGPPGTGKTLLARAVAGEAGIPFFSVSASEFVEVFVGRGAARVRDLFNEAKEHAPSIIFIDELDAVGGRRGKSFNDERDQTLNQLLTEMDGFESDVKVIVIAATNRPEALDSALCRPGRFSRKVFVGVPDIDGRRKILAIHLKGVPLDEDRSAMCNLVASLTPGFVGADLANIVNEAAFLAARRGGTVVTREDIMHAIEREKFGINGKKLVHNNDFKGLAKLFPWLSSAGGNGSSENGLQGLMGYHTLS